MYQEMSYDFNSHARVGRDCELHRIYLGRENFNSHARVGRDLRNACPVQRICKFQLTRPCRA